ncbi:hypothetical protein CTAYLR_009976 [Chrysophaeum taylorii]|uniref:Uncharacterized protein n=1 Tax=Chrysophaeum taylorii TaxID=2483200 RepID=A0AAD7XP40_9STRA|nr:hypothetical protein CTAYLR_009976 [Chrysophaeum taylorii]
MFVALIFVLFVFGASKSVHAPEVVEAAEFVVSQLARISDSGIYRTLSVRRIVAAEESRGIFHNNTFLTLELASPYFESGSPVETFEAIVMVRDGERAMAIDAFPEMRDDAVEAFEIEAIERRREARDQKINEPNDEALSHPSHDLVAALRDVALDPNRRELARVILDQRARRDHLNLIVDLAKLPTSDLVALVDDSTQHLDRRALANKLLTERMARSDE